MIKMIGKMNDVIIWLLKQDKELTFEIKLWKNKRSLNANDYYWVLVNKIADVLKTSKEQVHLDMLKSY